MKKILTVSLVAMMAVSTARADIASTDYVQGAVSAEAALRTSAINTLSQTVGANKTAADKTQEDLDTLETTVAGHTQTLSTLATSGTVSALAERVGTAETDIDNIEKSLATGGATANLIAEAKTAGTTAQNQLTSYKTEVSNTYATKSALSGVKTTADAALPKTTAASTYQTLANIAKSTDTVQDADADARYPSEKRMMLKITQSVGNVNSVVEDHGAAIDALETAVNTLDTNKQDKSQIGVVSKENMGTDATTVVAAIKEVAGEAAAAQTQANKGVADAATALSTANAKLASVSSSGTGVVKTVAKDGTAVKVTAGAVEKSELATTVQTSLTKADNAATAASVAGAAIGTKATTGTVAGNYVLTAKINAAGNVESYTWELVSREYTE